MFSIISRKAAFATTPLITSSSRCNLFHTISKIPSIGFSGAGFLGAYHIGVASCLVRHGILLSPGEIPSSSSSAGEKYPILLGASAGAITSAAVSAGVSTEDSMSVVFDLAKRTREQGGWMDVFRPGFSLIDQVSDLLLPMMNQAVNGDEELFLRRIENGRLLRIALTDTRTFKPLSEINNSTVSPSYCYIDRYRNMEDVAAACILSSFVPMATGPLRGDACTKNKAVKLSLEQIQDLGRLGAIKDGRSEDELLFNSSSSSNEKEGVDDEESNVGGGTFLDGGFANMFPTVDENTVIVSPISGTFDPNPSISPGIGNSDYIDTSHRTFRMHNTSLHINKRNAEALKRVTFSSDDSKLEEIFQNGYDDTSTFLDQHSMLKVFTNK